MSLDFNDSPAQPEPQPKIQYDVKALSHALADCAELWIPEIFPLGKIDGDDLRLANISGAPPRKNGSCVVHLRGEHAGGWYDYTLGRGGEAISTIKEAFNLAGTAVFERVAEIVERYGGGKPNGHAKPRRNGPVDHAPRADDIKRRSIPLAGTLAETYLRSRGLTTLPDTPDLLYCDDVTDYAAQIGRPAMIGVLRYPDGTLLGGIHRTFLKLDGSSKADMPKPRMELGPSKGAVIMLGSIGPDGRLGIGEGIETALSGGMLFDVPVWAATSTGGLKSFGEAIADDRPPPGLRELIIFADIGPDGESAAAALCSNAKLHGIAASVVLPRGGDDFNDDLVRGLWSVTDEPESEIIPPFTETDQPSIMDVAVGFSKNYDASEIVALLARIALEQLEPIAERRVLDEIKRRTGLNSRALDGALKDEKRKLGIGAKSVGKSRMPGWWSKMITYDSGEPKPNVSNAITALREAPEWQGVIAYNEFRGRAVICGKAPWMTEFREPEDWSDHTVILATVWLQQQGVDVTPQTAGQAIHTVARDHTFHPVREYLDSLKWDGKARLTNWLPYYLGVEPDPIENENDKEETERWNLQLSYIHAVGPRFLISAVARIFQPGAKADCALILVGPQGALKSTAIRTLSSPWFTDDVADVGNKDAQMQICGVWIVEFAELTAFRRGESERIKGFMSRAVDRFRPPFGHHIVEQPRQCVFAGSTNEKEFLRDPTGQRRWWSVECGKIVIPELNKDRDQLWAEACHRYREGELWWLHEKRLIDAAAIEQEGRSQTDPWQDRVAECIAGKQSITRAEVLQYLGVPDRDQTQVHANRVADCLTRAKWHRKQVRIGTRRIWRYEPMPPVSPVSPMLDFNTGDS
jgi:putative DNA primase/helicase